MPLYDLAQAKIQTAALNARMAAAKADSTFAAKKASFEQQFRDIFSNTSLAQADGSTPSTTVLYSGGVKSSLAGNSAGNLARQVAMENPGRVGIIDNTHVGKLADSSEARTALAHLFGKPDAKPAKDFMFKSRGEVGTPGVFDALSERFAGQISGKVVTISPNGEPNRILSATEVPALLDNSKVGSINDVELGIFKQMHATELSRTGSRAAADGLVANAINAKSAEIFNGARIYDGGQNVGGRIADFGDVFSRAGVSGVANSGVPEGRASTPLNVLEGAKGATADYVNNLVSGSKALHKAGVAGTLAGAVATAVDVVQKSQAGDYKGASQAVATFVASEAGAYLGGRVAATVVQSAVLAAAAYVGVPVAGGLALAGAGLVLGSTLVAAVAGGYYAGALANAIGDFFGGLFGPDGPAGGSGSGPLGPLFGPNGPFPPGDPGDPGAPGGSGNGGNGTPPGQDPDDPDDPLKPPPRDPLVVDLDGDGIELVSLENSTAYFDLNADGFREKVAWVAADDGLLVHDKNGNGKIDDVNELFGLGDRDGFEILAGYDSNDDNVINADDAQFASLRIWRDADGDGVVDPGELMTLAEAGVRSIALHSTLSTATVAGNRIGRDGTYTGTDGESGVVRSVWFASKTSDSEVIRPAGYTEDPQAARLPELRGYGTVGDLRFAMTMDRELKTSVQTLVTASATQSGADFLDAFEAVLFKWAGVEDTAEDGRGRHVNGRHLAVLEAFYGTGFAQPTRGGNPSPDPLDAVTGQGLETLYRNLADSIAVRFAAQTMAGAFQENTDWSAVYQHKMLAFVSGSNLDYDPQAGTLSGNLDKVIGALSVQAHLNGTSAIETLIDSLPLIKALRLDLFGFGDADNTRFLKTLENGVTRYFQSASLADMAVAFASGAAITTGTAAADTLAGTANADIFVAGKGDDVVDGRAGADSYVYTLGDGDDVITDVDYRSGVVDRVLLHGLTPSQVTVGRSNNGNDLVLGMPDGGSVTVKNQFRNAYNGIEQVVFDDGTTWSRADIRVRYLAAVSTTGDDTITGFGGADVITGGTGDDVIDGKAGADSYVYTLGDGDDTITDLDYSSGVVDRLVLHGITPSQVTVGRSGNGNDLVLTMPDGGSVTVKNQFRNAYNGIEQVVFDDGTTWSRADIRVRYLATVSTTVDDTITGFGGADVITGGTGDDVIDGKAGADSYVYTLGDGDDTITDLDYSSGVVDRLLLHGITPSQVTVGRSADGYDPILTMPDGGSVTVRNEFRNAYNGIEQVVFDDGTTWGRADLRLLYLTAVSTSGDDTITGFGGADVINGGTGDDVIDGWAGADSYVYSLGDGDDTITDLDYSSGVVDRLLLHGITPSQVTVGRSGNGNDLVLGMPDGGSVTVKNQFRNAYNGIEQVVFDDGTTWSRADIRVRYLATVSTTVDDTITGFGGADVITGGTGDDVIDGKAGADSYVYTLGDGDDTITDLDYSSGVVDRLLLHGITPSQVTVGRSGNGNDLVLGMPDGGSVTVKNQFRNAYNGIEQVVFDDGNTWSRADIRVRYLAAVSTKGDDTITGFGGADVITGGTGDDVIDGKAGADSYVYTLGDGDDTITDLDYSSGVVDRLLLHGITPSQVTVARSPDRNNLVLSMPDGGSIIVRDQFRNAYNGIEQVVFDDGTTWSLDDLERMADGASATAINRPGTDGADTLRGTAGKDGFDGGAGDDRLAGGDSNDTYYYDRGDGNDVIIEGRSHSSTDVLRFRDLNAGDVVLSRNTSDLFVTVTATGEKVTVDDQFHSSIWGESGIERIEFADGTVWDRARIMTEAWFRGTDRADTLTGSSADDNLDGGAGDDRLAGGDSNDTYYYDRGDGNDVIIEGRSHSSTDVLRFRDLNAGDVVLSRNTSDLFVTVTATGEKVTVDDQFHSSIWGESGIERIEFADGTVWDRARIMTEAWFRGTDRADTLTGSSADDNLDGGAGNDRLLGGDGSDTYYYDRGDGNDVIDEGRSRSSTDVLRFRDLNAGDVVLSRNASDLFVTVMATGERISVDDQFRSSIWGESGIERIEFADGTTWDRDRIEEEAWFRGTSSDDAITGSDDADTIAGGGGNDTLNGGPGDDRLIGGRNDDALLGGTGSDVYVYNSGDGNDTITEIGRSGDNDVLRLADVNSSDVALTRSLLGGLDLLITVTATAETIRVAGHFRNGQSGLEEIRFADGVTWDRAAIRDHAVFRGTDEANTITGSAGNDTIIGGGGYDVLDGAEGSDTYLYARSDASDTIDESGSRSDTDTLRLTDLNAADVTLTRTADDADTLRVTIRPTGQVITIDDQFRGLANGIERIEFADGTVWGRARIESETAFQGTSGDDTITASARADRIDGGGGNDRLAGGDGDDVIAGGEGNDRLDGGNGDDQLTGGEGNDTLSGGHGSDIYRYRSGDGNDVIDEDGTSSDIDRLVFEDMNRADVSFARAADTLADMVITVNATGETIRVDDQFAGARFALEEIRFADGTVIDPFGLIDLAAPAGTSGDDSLTGSDNLRDSLHGAGGDDMLNGLGGDDTYFYNPGDGNETITEGWLDGTGDRLVLGSGITASGVTFSRSASDLDDVTLHFAGGGSVMLDEQFSRYSHAGIEEVAFADGTVWSADTLRAMIMAAATTDGDDVINGFDEGAETLRGGLGDDTLNGLRGNDTYVYNPGDGDDTITEDWLDGTGDRLVLGSGITAFGVTVTRSASDLDDVTLHFAGGGSVMLDEQFSRYSYAGIEEVAFADGTVWDRARILSEAWFRGTTGDDTITGSSGADRIDGGAGDDRLDGGDGDDRLIGGAGDDVLSGGSGDDLFVFRTGFGRDTVTDFSAGEDSDDVIEFDSITGVSTYAQVLARAADDGTHTTITIDADNSIVLQNVVVADLGADDFRFA